MFVGIVAKFGKRKRSILLSFSWLILCQMVCNIFSSRFSCPQRISIIFHWHPFFPALDSIRVRLCFLFVQLKLQIRIICTLALTLPTFLLLFFFLNKYPGFIMCVRHMNWLSAGREVEKYIPNIKPKNIFILRIFAVFVPFIDTFLFQRDDEWCQIKTGINGRKKVMCF